MNDPGPEPSETKVALRGLRTSKRVEKEDEFQPRYVGVTTWRDRGKGPRNLAWGSVLFALALLLLAWGIQLGGARAFALVTAALLAAGVLFIAARSRLLRQRNGGFLALALVALVSALLVLAEQGSKFALVYGATHRMDAAPGDVIVARQVEPEIVALVDAFHLPPPSSAAARVKILRKAKVQIDGRTYLLREGDQFVLTGKNGGEVRFTAGNQQLALGESFVDILAPEPNGDSTAQAQNAVAIAAAPPAATPPSSVAAPQPVTSPVAPVDPLMQITERAQKEAIKRYPGIGVKGSPENLAFAEKYHDLKNAGEDDFFKDPEWPLLIAEEVAAKEGWKRDNYEPMPGDGEPPATPETPESAAAASPVEMDGELPLLPQ